MQTGTSDQSSPGSADLATEQELLTLGFAHIGSFQNGTFTWETKPEPVPGVYVMVLADRAFNIGESESLRGRILGYAPWLARRYNEEGERHKRENRVQQRWAAMIGDKRLDIYARPSDTVEIFGHTVSLRKAEEEALTKRFLPPWNARSRAFGSPE